MTAHDRTANEPGTAHLRVCPRPDDADVAAAVVADPHLDRATAARLRDTSRRTRPRSERYLLAAGHLSATGSASDGGRPGGGRRRSTVVPLAPAGRATPPVADEGPDVVDQRRDLTRRDQVILALVEQIDELHRRRVDSPSARERQIAAKALGEALYRIVAGYQEDYEPPHRAVLALRRADRALGRACERLAARGPRRQALVRWWARVGQWVRLLLAVASLVLLWHQVLVAAAVTVGARALLSAGLYSPAPPPSRRQQVLGYDPGWVVVFYTHAGDAAILTGLGVGLHMAGHTVWGIATAFAGLFGVIAAMLRALSGQHGFRLERCWFDRVAMTVVLPTATIGAVLAPPEGHGMVAGVPLAGGAGLVAAFIGVCEVGRAFYYALVRRRLFRRAAEAQGVMSDAIVAHTADGIVVNLRRDGTRPELLPLDPAPPLQAVGDDSVLDPERGPGSR